MIEVRPAVPEELQQVKAFYHMVSEACRDLSVRWPDDAMLEKAVSAGELYLCFSQNNHVGAMLLDQRQPPEYEQTVWETEAEPEQIAVLHGLCVLPEATGDGLGDFMVRIAIEHAARSGLAALRTDAAQENQGARALLKHLGFHETDTVSLYDKTRGLIESLLLERKLAVPFGRCES